jgi:hypothetical protein
VDQPMLADMYFLVGHDAMVHALCPGHRSG